MYIWDVADCVVMAEMAKSIDGEAVMGSISNRRCKDNLECKEDEAKLQKRRRVAWVRVHGDEGRYG